MLSRLCFLIGLLFLSLFGVGIMFYIWMYMLDPSFENDLFKKILEWFLILSFAFFGISAGVKVRSRNNQ
ncbi:hypothetical protein IBE33_09260 [Francisella philomiragia]|uniref:Uncharacterized protein n=1 Tax=Francisella tularensis subsp. novicida PA10-7858 TaxID=1386968 RepID=V5T9B1_FRANO|nr:hypothetical protein [Francisella philomiragia]AHB60812.1 hypothetical protein N894_0044 [Francisella tularensis subsp. novicida PA10-7858]MBK2341697.1 hypothetical protein [Francisella philomiragia]